MSELFDILKQTSEELFSKSISDSETLECANEGCDQCGDYVEKSKKDGKPFKGYNPKKHSRTGGLNAKERARINAEEGSNLKAPVTEKNPSGKKAARRRSFCARMRGNPGPTSKDGKLTPKGAALKRWNCGSVKKSWKDLDTPSLKEMVEEHERLVARLKSETKKDDAKELKIQIKELAEYKQELKQRMSKAMAINEEIHASTLDTNEYSIDEMGADNHPLIGRIDDMMKDMEYGSAPREMDLEDKYKLILVRSDDGIYSGHLKEIETGEMKLKIEKMNTPGIVQALKGKGYLTDNTKDSQIANEIKDIVEEHEEEWEDREGSPEEQAADAEAFEQIEELVNQQEPESLEMDAGEGMEREELSEILDALQGRPGDIHIHFHKAVEGLFGKCLDNYFEKGRKPAAIGSKSPDGKYVKTADGWKPVKNPNFKEEKLTTEPDKKEVEKIVEKLQPLYDEIFQHNQKRKEIWDKISEKYGLDKPRTDFSLEATKKYVEDTKKANEELTETLNSDISKKKENFEKQFKVLLGPEPPKNDFIPFKRRLWNSTRQAVELKLYTNSKEKFTKSLGEYFEKGKKMPIGTVRPHGGDDYKKVAEGKWVKVTNPRERQQEDEERAHSRAKELAEMKTGKKEESKKDSKENQKESSEVKKPETSQSGMVGDVKISTRDKELKQRLTDYINDSDKICAEMGIKFKTPIKFTAKNIDKNKRKYGTFHPKGKTQTGPEISIHSSGGAGKTLMHEIGHAVDYAMAETDATIARSKELNRIRVSDDEPEENKSLREKYRELKNIVTSSEYYGEQTGAFRKYLQVDTEVFARGFEVYSWSIAKEMEDKGQLTPGFVDSFLPDVFKMKDPKKGENLEKYNKVKGEIRNLENKLYDTSGARFEVDTNEILPKLEDLRQQANGLREQIWDNSPIWIEIDEDRKQDYIQKISTLMKDILSSEEMRKALDLLNSNSSDEV